MAFSLKTSRDLDGLREVSFVWNLNHISPAALEVLGEHRCDVFDLGWTWSRRTLVLLLNWNSFFSSFGDQLAADGFALNSAVKSTKDSATVAEFSRVSVWIHLTFRS